MGITFAIIAAMTFAGALAAMTLRNLVHCALALAVSFAGFAALYLQLGAPFVGWSQVVVYIGAVAILILFAILLTRSDDGGEPRIFSKSWAAGAVICLCVFGVLTASILQSGATNKQAENKPEPTVKEIGMDLMTHYILPLETIGLLLTAAAIGAVIIALKDKTTDAETVPSSAPSTNARVPENHHH